MIRPKKGVFLPEQIEVGISHSRQRLYYCWWSLRKPCEDDSSYEHSVVQIPVKTPRLRNINLLSKTVLAL